MEEILTPVEPEEPTPKENRTIEEMRFERLMETLKQMGDNMEKIKKETNDNFKKQEEKFDKNEESLKQINDRIVSTCLLYTSRCV